MVAAARIFHWKLGCGWRDVGAVLRVGETRGRPAATGAVRRPAEPSRAALRPEAPPVRPVLGIVSRGGAALPPGLSPR